MIRGCGWGVGAGLTGRLAARLAMQKALDRVGTGRPALAVALVSEAYDIHDVCAGLTASLGDASILGLSTACPFGGDGEHPRSVVVGILTGNELKANIQWWPAYGRDIASTSRLFLAALKSGGASLRAVLLAGDGVFGGLNTVLNEAGQSDVALGGGLGSGNYGGGSTFQIGGGQCGAGGLAAAMLGGRFRLGIGYGSGWRPIGMHFTVTRMDGDWVKELDGKPAIHAYETAFGYPAAQWSQPPLKDMVRLYPLGMEMYGGSSDYLLRSPLDVGVDGSLRMNAPLAEGQTVHLMLGNPDGCIKAAEQAARQALESLGKARPLLAMVLTDLAWRMLFPNAPARFIDPVVNTLGEVPMVGAYTLGQVARPAPLMAPQVFNQQIQVIVFGEGEG